jgi:hypothetical protein
MEQRQHEMVLELTHTSGMQGWYCPACGRRILFLVPPNDEMIIVELGDANASHNGGAGGLRLGTVQVVEHNEEEISDKRLRPWLKALKDLDLNW